MTAIDKQFPTSYCVEFYHEPVNHLKTSKCFMHGSVNLRSDFFFFFKDGRGERKKYILKKTLSQSIPVRDIEG